MKKRKEKSDRLGPSDLHITSGSTHTHTFKNTGTKKIRPPTLSYFWVSLSSFLPSLYPTGLGTGRAEKSIFYIRHWLRKTEQIAEQISSLSLKPVRAQDKHKWWMSVAHEVSMLKMNASWTDEKKKKNSSTITPTPCSNWPIECRSESRPWEQGLNTFAFKAVTQRILCIVFKPTQPSTLQH